ncbi:MAG: class I SAM-dependent methyltransferase [Gemmatimonadales bacterium]
MTTPASRPSLPPSAATLPSHEFGLAMGLIFGRYFLDMRDLHYGYWPDDLAVEPRNLAQAQTAYTAFLMSHIPEGVRSILDVGCGAGNTARKLLDRGYRVDCVSPNSFLTSVAREVLGDRATVFETKFEDLETDRRYDLLLFSESFLFIKPDAALPQASRLLTPGGYLLMTDIFKVPADGKSPIGGGHQLPVFRQIMAGAPFELVRDVDMTAGIAPTFDLLDQAYAGVIKPAYDLLTARLAYRYPWLTRLVRWKFRKKIERYEQKHFSGRRNAANFAKYKSYRLFLYRKRETG